MKVILTRNSRNRLIFQFYVGVVLVLLRLLWTHMSITDISLSISNEWASFVPHELAVQSRNMKLRLSGISSSSSMTNNSYSNSDNDSSKISIPSKQPDQQNNNPASETTMTSNQILSSRHTTRPNVRSTTTYNKEVPSNSSSPYAYSFVVGGVDDEKPAYKGFLYNILVAVNILKKQGSIADFVVYLQLSPNATRNDLPEEDVQHLASLGVKVIAMEKPRRTSFTDLMLEKFRSLQLTQYRRVIYLDSDVMPLANLDYLFFLSDPENDSMPTLIKPSIIWTSRCAPCNGGMFMMHPYKGAWEELAGIVERQRIEGLKLPYPHFSRERGWGHDFQAHGDVWEAIHCNDSSWNFHGDFTDQGLWFYYAKYVVQDVTIILGNRTQNWRTGEVNEFLSSSLPILESEQWNIFTNFTAKEPLAFQWGCNLNSGEWTCYPPSRDMAHFMGSTKPWQVGVGTRWFKETYTDLTWAPHRLWFQELEEVSRILNLGLDIENWDTVHKPMMEKSPLGYLPKWTDNEARIFENAPKTAKALFTEDS